MTRALVEAMEHQTPGTVFDGFPSQMVRFLCGDELADMLGVDSRNWTSLLTGPLRLFARHSDAVADNVPFVGRISAHFSQQLLEGLSWVARGAIARRSGSRRSSPSAGTSARPRASWDDLRRRQDPARSPDRVAG